MLARSLCASLALLVTQAGAIGHSLHHDAVLHDRLYYVEDFQKWMFDYRVTFKTRGEYERRLENFIHNSDLIELHNSANRASYTLAHNEFSHLSWHEFKATHLGYRRPARAPRVPKAVPEVETSISRRRLLTVPDEVDWTVDGAVTPVQNQGMCGSCWAFSAIGAMEGAYFMETGELMKFSEEQLVDCDKVDQGCNGGDMGQAFDWIKQNGGVCDEDAYPYEGLWPPFKTCFQTCSVIGGTEVKEWKQVDATDAALVTALAEVGPIAIAIEADQVAFQFYHSGVLTAACGSSLDHGVLLVGYGTAEDGTDYWKVKNSWGESWGMDGYILLERSDSEEGEGGECGILLEAVYPVLGTPEESPRMELPVVVREPGFESSAEAEDCGAGQTEAVFNSLVISPSNPARGAPIAMNADGILTQPVASTSYDMTVAMGDTRIFEHHGSLCGDSEAELPIGMGTVEIHGMQCPAPPGPVSISFSLTMPIIAPPGEYGINLSADDGNGASLLCIDVLLDM